MDLDEARAFLVEHHRGVLATARADERPHLLIEQYRAVAGEHPDWDEFRQAMQDQRRVIVRIDIERAGPDRQG